MKCFAFIGGLIAFVTVILCLRPAPILAEKDCVVLKRTITKIYESGVKDVVFELQGQNQNFM